MIRLWSPSTLVTHHSWCTALDQRTITCRVASAQQNGIMWCWCVCEKHVTGAGVLQVVAILEQTRSSYLSTFLSLRKAIQQEAVVAEDNLKFLQCLEQPCRTLAGATAKVPSSCMPGPHNVVILVSHASGTRQICLTVVFSQACTHMQHNHYCLPTAACTTEEGSGKPYDFDPAYNDE